MFFVVNSELGSTGIFLMVDLAGIKNKLHVLQWALEIQIPTPRYNETISCVILGSEFVVMYSIAIEN